jgi:dihydroorotase
MDWSHKGDFATETAAAVAGGYWAVFDMPNTPPPTVDSAALNHKLEELKSQAVCDWGVYFCASANGNWEQFDSIQNNVCGIKMFNNATTGNLLVDDPTIREAHYQHWPGDKPFVNHAENETCAQIIGLVRKYRKPTHIAHICTTYEVKLITEAKSEGLPITCGVCPHHLWLTGNDLSRLGSLGWMKPHLQTHKDQEALWNALANGSIDVVESDHAPHTLEEKSKAPAPYGVPGLETTLPLLLTAVQEKRLSLDRLIELVSLRPRHIWKLAAPADTYCLIDLDLQYTISNSSLHTKCGWSPFEGMKVKGKVIETRIRGTKVYDGENVLIEPGFGKNLYG